MKKSCFFLLLLVGLLPLQSLAQLALLRDNGTGLPITANPYGGVKGSAYLEDFKKGILYLKTGQKVEGLYVALNSYNSTLEYKLEGGLFAYTPDKLVGFSIPIDGGSKEFTSEYVLPTLKVQRFVQVLEKGKYTLLFHPYKIMTDDPSATYGAQASKVFQDYEEFFVAVNGKVFLVKNKEKDLKEVFGSDLDKAMSIIKSQKINFKNAEELKALIRQLNQ
jgi:DNA helicase HerA-like ATPase